MALVIICLLKVPRMADLEQAIFVIIIIIIIIGITDVLKTKET